MNAKIKKICAREILDSRGFPTVETEVWLSNGIFARASCPSGASTGSHEALEIRDGDKRYHGKGVLKAVEHVNSIIGPELVGFKVGNQIQIDELMKKLDGTPTKSKLGANAILSVSMAVIRAAASSYKLPLYAYIRKVYSIPEKDYLLPVPMLNIINGGKHADSGLNIQEFMIVPTGAHKFSEGIRIASEIYHTLKSVLLKGGYTVSVGDEGGFAPKIFTHEVVIETIIKAIQDSGYTYKNVQIAIDSAASEFYKNNSYVFEGSSLSYRELTSKYADWKKHFPIISYEDPLAEDDWEGWQYLTKQLSRKMRIIGDDLFVTNPSRLKKGIQEKVANAILIKLNQIGTVTETVEVINIARRSDYEIVISHRSGETEDSFIADFAVGVNAGAIKSGAPSRSERLAKYNQLIRIEQELDKKAHYAKDFTFKI